MYLTQTMFLLFLDSVSRSLKLGHISIMVALKGLAVSSMVFYLSSLQ